MKKIELIKSEKIFSKNLIIAPKNTSIIKISRIYSVNEVIHLVSSFINCSFDVVEEILILESF
jgi:hypothetical protein